jgi:hypothetical protein
MALFTQPAPAEAPPQPLIHAAAFSQPMGKVFEHTPTAEQGAIIDAGAVGTDLVVAAGAGTGKTSTLKMVAAARTGRILYFAYNRAIADDARATFPTNAHCATAHSLAYRAVGHTYQARLNGPRLPARDVARILGIPAVLDLGKHALTAPKVARLVSETVARFCHSADQHIDPHHVPAVPGLDDPASALALRTALTPIATRAWHDINSTSGRLRFTHDHYLKIWALTHPALPYDLLMLDEAQDASPVIADVVARQHAQRILVGDSSQAIYGWRGAIDAMATFDGDRLALTQSWRFGDAIAAEANLLLALIGAPLRLTGNPARASEIAELPAPRAVLCRTNAGAIAQAMAMLAADKKVAMVGDGAEIRALAEACQALQAGKPVYHPELMAFKSWREVQEYAENDSGGADLKVLVKLIDTHGPEKILATVDALSSELLADIVVSTAHKAKGREWPTVRLAGDFPEMIDPETGQLKTAEAMLAYVAITRAQDVLDHAALWIPPGEQTPVVHSPADIHRTPLVPAPAAAAGQDSPPVNIPQLPAPAQQETPAAQAPDPVPVKVELPPEAAGWLSLAQEAATNEASWKAVKERAEEQLKALIGNAEEATIGGVTVATWRWSKPGGQLDAKQLQEDHPDIYDAYYRPKKAGRPFNRTGEYK